VRHQAESEDDQCIQNNDKNWKQLWLCFCASSQRQRCLQQRWPIVTTANSSISALVIMGVSGCGKSVVGADIAQKSGGRLIEGDAFHPPANIKKMSEGHPLDDQDRAGWLIKLGEEMAAALRNGEHPVLTCSSLKLSYRENLRAAVPGLGFVFLELTREMAAERCSHRPGHFMPASLVDSQFATLEPPYGEDRTLVVDASQPVDVIGTQAADWWKASKAS
jgi:gluconokinase